MTAWENVMVQRMADLGMEIAGRGVEMVASRSGASFESSDSALQLAYWGRDVRITWPGLQAAWLDSGEPLSVYDTAMLVYYLHTADGAPSAGRWVNFRELPDGTFYHQAFQGYSGNRLAAHFGMIPERFARAAEKLNGKAIKDLGTLAYRFQALPRVELAAMLWPGDEEFPARAQVLFDAGACHYLTIDGCAMIGSGLVGRLIKADQ